MSRYMFIARYDGAGVQADLAGFGSAQASAIEKAAVEHGGRLESFDFAFGEDDVYTVVELPDHRAAAAVSLAVSASSRAKVRTVVLMRPEDVDAAGESLGGYGGYRPDCLGADDPEDQVPDTLGIPQDER